MWTLDSWGDESSLGTPPQFGVPQQFCLADGKEGTELPGCLSALHKFAISSSLSLIHGVCILSWEHYSAFSDICLCFLYLLVSSLFFGLFILTAAESRGASLFHWLFHWFAPIRMAWDFPRGAQRDLGRS